MVNYAVISVNGTQEKVVIGDVVRVRGEVVDGDYLFNEVLALGGDNLVLGKPYAEGASVVGKVGGTFKGVKIRVSTFKAKSNKHRVRGYRDIFTNVTITNIKVS